MPERRGGSFDGQKPGRDTGAGVLFRENPEPGRLSFFPFPAVELFDVGDDLALGNVHGGEAHFRGVLHEEFPRRLDALPDAAFVPADGY